jgi:hypothetical protein
MKCFSGTVLHGDWQVPDTDLLDPGRRTAQKMLVRVSSQFMEYKNGA